MNGTTIYPMPCSCIEPTQVRRPVCHHSSCCMVKSRAYPLKGFKKSSRGHLRTEKLSCSERGISSTYRIWPTIGPRRVRAPKEEWLTKLKNKKKRIERTPWVLEILF